MSDDRNSRLDALAASVKEWSAAQQKVLNEQVTVSKALLKGRRGADRLAQASVTAASALVSAEVDDFLKV